ncbi:uncharacterized protein [Gossypium hirsutum]|uniref:Uncharacterized protein isoform X1 n=1 Tax=Gossypium hirsutum TaxID=3635 RepID=A0A1U8PQ77_GOSHI|nr:uncharacterized protein LOC107961746 isoform X1 [Gossypium hirsutum]
MQWTKLLLLPIPSSSSTFQSGASSKLRFLSTSIAATFGIPYLKNTYCFCQRPPLANWCPTSLADLFTCIKGISFQPPAFVNLNLSTSSMPTHKPLFPPQKAKESSQSRSRKTESRPKPRKEQDCGLNRIVSHILVLSITKLARRSMDVGDLITLSIGHLGIVSLNILSTACIGTWSFC